MGQPITIAGTTVEGDVAAFHTDRGITGQDGVSFVDASEATAAGSVPGDLAARLLGWDETISDVFMASNQVVVTRRGGWDDGSLQAAAGIVTDYFVFYSDA